MEINEEDLAKKYESLTNDELLELLDNKFRYTDVAVKTAIIELSKRNISEEDIKGYKTKLTNELEKDVLKLVYYDLKIYQKILFYIFWLPIFNFAFKMNYRERGEYLKIKQANYYSLLGFVFCMVVSIIGVNYNLGEFSFIYLWLSCIIPTYVFDEFFNRNNTIQNLKKRLTEHTD